MSSYKKYFLQGSDEKGEEKIAEEWKKWIAISISKDYKVLPFAQGYYTLITLDYLEENVCVEKLPCPCSSLSLSRLWTGSEKDKNARNLWFYNNLPFSCVVGNILVLVDVIKY